MHDCRFQTVPTGMQLYTAADVRLYLRVCSYAQLQMFLGLLEHWNVFMLHLA